MNQSDGSVLLMALLFLVILTMLGMTGLRRANTDLTITRNYKTYKENFYLADGAAYEAAQRIAENASVRSVSGSNWLFQESSYPGGEALKGGHGHWNNAITGSFSNSTEYIAYKNDTAPNDRYRIFARSTNPNSNVLIEIMYQYGD